MLNIQAVRGYVDLLDTSGRVIELKSTARKPSDVSPDHRFQVQERSDAPPSAVP